MYVICLIKASCLVYQEIIYMKQEFSLQALSITEIELDK